MAGPQGPVTALTTGTYTMTVQHSNNVAQALSEGFELFIVIAHSTGFNTYSFGYASTLDIAEEKQDTFGRYARPNEWIEIWPHLTLDEIEEYHDAII